MKSLNCVFLSNQTAALHQRHFWNQSCQAEPHFLFPFLDSPRCLPCYLSAVVRNDLNFSTRFLFFLSRWHLFTSTSFLWEKFEQMLPNCILSLTRVMYVYVDLCEWGRAWNDSPISLSGDGSKENMWLYAVKQGALAPSCVINNRREAVFQVWLQGSCLVEMLSPAARTQPVNCETGISMYGSLLNIN